MSAHQDPLLMALAERDAELAALLATGYLRMRQKALAACAENEAPCDRTVNSRENGKDVA